MSALARPLGRFSAAFDRLPAVARGGSWAVAASLCTVGFTILAKHVAADLPVPMIVFFRSLFGIVFLAPWLMRAGVVGLKTERPFLLMSRGFNSLLGLYFVFLAAKLLPVADIMAIMFSKPVFAAGVAVVVLGEIMHRARWIATAVAIVGMLVIVRPGFADINIGVTFALGGMVTAAYTAISVKLSTRTDPPDRIVAYTLVCMMLGSTAPAIMVWQTPTWEQLGWLVAIGALANGFQRCMTRSFAAADTTVVLPFEFSRLIFAAAIGYLAFGDVADMWTWIGGTIVFCGAFYMVRAEAKRERKTVKPAAG